MSGLAASVHLAKAGFRVVCLDPATDFSHIVGESLDWSAPDLFHQLELRMEDLIHRQVSTFKRHVVLKLPDDSMTEYVPSPWLGRPPLNIDLRTMHVDRLRLHQALKKIALKYGVVLVHDRVTRVDSTQKCAELRQASNWSVGTGIVFDHCVAAPGGAPSIVGMPCYRSRK